MEMKSKYVYCSNQACFFHTHLYEVLPGDSGLCPMCQHPPKEEKAENWLETVAKDGAYWAEGAEQWPSVLAYEYRGLRSFCENRQPYAVLLCLKDNFETLLKTEVLLAYAWADQNAPENVRDETICRLATPNLSMGAWVELARLLLSCLKDAGTELPEGIPLKRLAEFYQKNAIVNWRNAKIGHGAMELSEDREFQDEVKHMILLLKNILAEIQPELESQVFTAGERILRGPGMARDLDVPAEEKVECCVRGSSVRIRLFPFVLIRKHQTRGCGVYFFDNQKSRTLTVFQAYAEGSRANENVEYFNRLKKQLDNRGIALGADADDAYLTEAENRELEAVGMEHGFVRPAHLAEWLKECVEKHKRGVFLLQMERGTGKSAFADKLNALYPHPLVVAEDMDVRTYHFARSQAAGSEDARSRIQWLWANQYGGGTWQRVPRIEGTEKDGTNLKRAVADFLAEALRYAKHARHKNRLLMVFDGLDEIQEEALWNIMPEADQLADGVYILLTSRNPETEQLPQAVRERLDGIRPTESIRIPREGAGNRLFLMEYLKQTKSQAVTSLKEEEKERLLELAERRVLYVGLLCRLVENGVPVENLPEKKRIVGQYLELLEARYGERESIRMREILAVLSTLGSLEALTARQIAALSAENGLTLKLVGMIRDLSPLLKTERSGDGNRYSIVNPDLSEELARQLPETEDTVRDMIQLAMIQIRQGWPVELPETEPAAAHAAELGSGWLKEGKPLGEEDYTALSRFRDQAKKGIASARDRVRYIDYSRQCVECAAAVFGEEAPASLRARIELASAYSAAGSYREAAAVLEQVYGIRRRVLGGEHPDTLTALNNLAAAYSDLGRLQEALEAQEQVYAVRRRTLGEEHPDTMTALNNLAATYSDLGRLQEALEAKEKAYEIRKRILGEEHPDTLISLSNLAVTYSELGRLQEALAAQEQVYSIRRRILGEEHPDTMTALNNLAATYSDLGRHQEALKAKEKAYEIRKRILGEEHPYTLISLSNLAVTYSELGRHREALEARERVYEARRRILGEEHPSTMIALSNLAATYSALGRHQEALEAKERVYEARRRILGEEHPDTLTALSNLAVTYSELGRHKDALETKKRAYDARRRILGEEHPYTLISLSNLAVTYSDLGRHQEALEARRQVYEARRRIFGEEHPNTLIALSNLAATYSDLGRHREALEALERVYEVRRRILGTGHPDTLASMKKVSLKYFDLDMYEKSLSMDLEILEITVKAYGPESLRTATEYYNAAVSYSMLLRYREASGMMEKAYRIRLAKLGEKDPKTVRAQEKWKKYLELAG